MANRTSLTDTPATGIVPTARLARRERTAERGVDVRTLELELSRTVDGEVRFDKGSRGLYAQDASNYLHVPLGVVVPRTKEAVVAAVAACRAHGASIVARGGGTGLAGQTSNHGVVIDFSKYMRTILDIDVAQRRARVEPGVVCDALVHAVAPHHLTFGPKPATHDRCCFGGMVANNCGGMQAQMHGTAVNNVEAMNVVLYDGTRMHLGWMDDRALEAKIHAGGREGEIYAQLRALRERYAERIRERFPSIPRRVSGYNLDQLLPGKDGRFNVARALVGSEGTLATMLDITVSLIHAPRYHVVLVAGYPDIGTVGDHVPDVLPFEPTNCEGMDDVLVEHIKKKGMRSVKFLDVLPKGRAWLMVQLEGDVHEELRERAGRLLETLRRSALEAKEIEDQEQQEHLWRVRESGLGATAFVPGEPDTWPGWEDSAVAPDRLGAYLRDLRALYTKYGYHPSLYGHFGQGCVHCRVDFKLTSEEGVAHWRAFLAEAADLVCKKHGGSLSGEHGDGQSRAELLEQMFGADLVRAFREYKAIWDPDGKMNPGKIVDPYPITANLRLGAAYDPWQPKTHFQYPNDAGSFAHATLRCVGVGKCRRTGPSAGDDVMCPSYMVTHEERHSTRGRAHLLWEMVRGDTPIDDGWRDESVKEALDLCLACKGCKGECPVNVDVATYKAEFLSHYYEGRVRPRHAYAFGLIDQWARLASVAPGLVNLVTQAPGTRAIAKLAAGMAQRRTIPTFAPRTFRSWFDARGRVNAGAPQVVLWPDTFNNFFHPEVAIDAVTVLEHAGFEVLVPEGHVCCGRPLYDFGMLDRAEAYLENVLRVMKPHVDAGRHLVVLEPSCCSVLRDEMQELMPNRNEAKNLKEQTLLLSELLARHTDLARLPRLPKKAIAQGHCHHKSVLHFDDEKKVLEAIGLELDVLSAGCCGMAGSFGFEADKADVADACGERALLPKVRGAEADTLVVADGFSCKTQIAEHTARRGLHLAEVLAMAYEGEGAVQGAPFVESKRVRARAVAERQSMGRAAVTLGAVAAAAVGLAWLVRRATR